MEKWVFDFISFFSHLSVCLLLFLKFYMCITSTFIAFRKMDDEGLVMPLYWKCQELQAKLADMNTVSERQASIIMSIKVSFDSTF